MKKVFVLFIVLLSVFVLTSCSSNETTMTCTIDDDVDVYIYNDTELLSYTANGVEVMNAEERAADVAPLGGISNYIAIVVGFTEGAGGTCIKK